jgi:hypothetical protein
MRVIEVRDVWPERGLRARDWITIAEAMERVEEDGLRELLRRTFQGNRPNHIFMGPR